MILDAKLSAQPLTVEGAQALSRYREWAKVKPGFGASFIALHEASHAVTAVILEATVLFTEIVSRMRKDGVYAGYTEVETKTDTISRHHSYKLAIVSAAPIVLNAQLNIPDGDRMVDDDQASIDEIGAELQAGGSLFVPLADFRRHILKWTGSMIPGSIDAIRETARRLDIKKRLAGEDVRSIIETNQRPALPEIVRAACGFTTPQEKEQVVKSYLDNARYRSDRKTGSF